MKVVLLRVGIDKGLGGIYGPLFQDGSFEFVCIPEYEYDVVERTYGTVVGRYGKPLIDYFPESRRKQMMNTPVHVDPEFGTFTYGDPARLKSGLAGLEPGDLLVFYCGLKGWNCDAEGALYLAGFFEVQRAGKAMSFGQQDLRRLFAQNFHVRHERVYNAQREKLVLVKGTENSRLLKKAVRISAVRLYNDRPMHVLSHEMREKFSNFGGRVCIQRSAPRQVPPDFVSRAADYVKSLE